MKKYLRQLPLLLLLASIVKSVTAQTPVPLSCLDSIPAWMLQHHVPVIAASILEDGKIKQTKSFGNLENGSVASLNTLFNVASLTKPITAVTVLKLVDAGKWNLDEPLDKYWIDPDVKDDPRYKKLTTRIVLSHQTGFPNWRSGKLTFMFEPGTKYSYSGEGFEYLRHALEHKFNRTLQQLAYSVLFKPLDMKDTHYGWSKQMDSTRFADPHDKNGVLIKMTKNTSIISADWLVTTIGDYSKFAQSILNQRALSAKLFTQMVTPQVQMDGKPKENMGLGWEIMTPLENGEYLIMHTGSDDGVKTLIILLPQSKRGIILFTNGNNGFDIIIKTIREAFHIKELAQ